MSFTPCLNLADVRKLELASKRMLVSNGVFAITDEVLGGFTSDLRGTFNELTARLLTRAQVEKDFQETLVRNEEANRRAVSAAEDVLFTTFTRELAHRVDLSPRYISKQAEALNEVLWALARSFFLSYNERNTDCFFVIDEASRIVTATRYEELPVLFYYWTGSRNRPYRSQERYSMGAWAKPRAGQITFSSVIGQGILRELACADRGTLTAEGPVEPCQLALYTVTLASGSTRQEFPVLCGQMDSGRILREDECKALLALPVQGFTEEGSRSPYWLKRGGAARPRGLADRTGDRQALPRPGRRNGAYEAADERPEGGAGSEPKRAGGAAPRAGSGARGPSLATGPSGWRWRSRPRSSGRNSCRAEKTSSSTPCVWTWSWRNRSSNLRNTRNRQLKSCGNLW